MSCTIAHKRLTHKSPTNNNCLAACNGLDIVAVKQDTNYKSTCNDSVWEKATVGVIRFKNVCQWQAIIRRGVCRETVWEIPMPQNRALKTIYNQSLVQYNIFIRNAFQTQITNICVYDFSVAPLFCRIALSAALILSYKAHLGYWLLCEASASWVLVKYFSGLFC